MTINDLRSLDRNDVLGWLGLQARPSPGSWILSGLGFLGAGLLVGAAVALCVAPKPGRELREDLKDRLRRARTKADDVAPTITRDESRSPAGSSTY